MKSSAVFLDRDGVINRATLLLSKPQSPKREEDIEILPGSIDACHKLRDLGFLVFVVTNQPDSARGLITKDELKSINEKILRDLPITESKICFHDYSDNCKCRKPSPGALFDLARKHNVELKSSYMIGDRWTDISAGNKAGCKTILIGNGYSEQKSEIETFRANSLWEASLIIQKEEHEKYK
jgi:D-glycero-D-manno-heptose 1,7-bisphosphate phosphatase